MNHERGEDFIKIPENIYSFLKETCTENQLDSILLSYKEYTLEVEEIEFSEWFNTAVLCFSSKEERRKNLMATISANKWNFKKIGFDVSIEWEEVRFKKTF